LSRRGRIDDDRLDESELQVQALGRLDVAPGLVGDLESPDALREQLRLTSERERVSLQSGDRSVHRLRLGVSADDALGEEVSNAAAHPVAPAAHRRRPRALVDILTARPCLGPPATSATSAEGESATRPRIRSTG
jgi:hypothetical protein